MENYLPKKSMDGKTLFAMILLIVALAGALIYVKPLWGEVDSLKLGRDEKVTQKQKLNDQLAELKQLEADMQSKSEVSVQDTLMSIPVGFEQDKVIDDLDAIADVSNVKISGINFTIPSDVSEASLGKVKISLTVSADEGDLITFLKGLEGSSRKIVVKDIAVQVGETDIGSKIANFNLDLETYFQGKSK